MRITSKEYVHHRCVHNRLNAMCVLYVYVSTVGMLCAVGSGGGSIWLKPVTQKVSTMCGSHMHWASGVHAWL